MFLWYLFLYLLCGFVTFRVWAWRSKPTLIENWGKNEWKMQGLEMGYNDFPSMSKEPVWKIKNAAIISLILWWLIWILMGVYYIFCGFVWLAHVSANGVIPKDQGNPDRQGRN